MLKRTAVVLAMVMVLSVCGVVWADQLHVPDDYSTIQAAIDASIDGDTVIVADGIYTGDGNRDIDFGGRAITVKSENGPVNCIIDCLGGIGDQHRGFIFKNNEGANSILDGFTITHGYIGSGGGIYCTYSSPSIFNCIIKKNIAGDYGGGICCYRSSSPAITNCVIKGNRACDRGGGIYSFNKSYPVIANCTITDNSADRLDGGLYAEGAGLTIKNSIVWDNVPTQMTLFQSTILLWNAHAIFSYDSAAVGELYPQLVVYSYIGNFALAPELGEGCARIGVAAGIQLGGSTGRHRRLVQGISAKGKFV